MLIYSKGFIMAHNDFHKPHMFSIFRIIGNDLPPRDFPGSRIRVLKFLLENETNFEGVHKSWIVNCIHDLDVQTEILDLLQKHKAHHIVLPFNHQDYLNAGTKNEKVLQSIPINRARNVAMRLGKNTSRFAAVLDGDCYFDSKTWKRIESFIVNDQKTNNLKYYSIPLTRSNIEHVTKSDNPLGPFAEPQLMFRDDYDIEFNEKVPFGQADKLKLLYSLNHSQEPGKHHLLNNNKLCKSIGYVHHLSTGDELADTNARHRVNLRKKSINLMIKKLDAFCPPNKIQ